MTTLYQTLTAPCIMITNDQAIILDTIDDQAITVDSDMTYKGLLTYIYLNNTKSTKLQKDTIKSVLKSNFDIVKITFIK